MSKEAAMNMLTTGNPTPPPAAMNGAAPAEPEKLDSTRFAHLAKKESQLVSQREEFKKERDAFQKERDELLNYKKQVTEFQQTKEKDAIAAMKLAGFTDADILNYFASLEDRSTPEEKAAKAAQAEIKKFQDEQAAKEKKLQDERNDATIKTFRANIGKEIASDKDKYEYINFHGPIAEELIYETVATILEETKELISIKEAAELVEKHYEDQDKLMSTLKKRTPAEAAQEAKEKVEQLKAEVSPGMGKSPKTLSSRATATTAAAASPAKRETRSEKKERLANLIRQHGLTR